jgi:hypothetical protein
LLDVQPLDDGLDHQVAAGQLGQRGGRLQALLVRFGIGGVQAALVDQLVPLRSRRRSSRALGHGIGLGVEQQTVLPACAAIWAMPRPMAPAPTTVRIHPRGFQACAKIGASP